MDLDNFEQLTETQKAEITLALERMGQWTEEDWDAADAASQTDTGREKET